MSKIPLSDRAVLSAYEAADVFRVDYKTLRELLNTGEIVAERRGREWRILRSNLEAYFQRIAQQQTEARRQPVNSR